MTRRSRTSADRCTQCGEELEDDDIRYGITVCDECCELYDGSAIHYRN